MLRAVSVVTLAISVAALLASASPSNGLPLRLSTYMAATRSQVGDPPPEVSGTYITFDVPGGSFLTPNGINPRGEIVGGYYDTTWENFVLSDGVVHNTNPPVVITPCCNAGFYLVTISGINPEGDTVGSYNDINGAAAGFLLSHDGTYTTIAVPGAGCGVGTLPAGINSRGEVTGFYIDDATCGTHGFLLRKGIYTTIDVPESLGAMSGATWASAIDPHGNIVGSYNDNNFNVHSFRLSKKGEFTALPDVPAPGFQTWALGMNPQGDIVGASCCGPVGGWLMSRDGTVSTVAVPDSCGSMCTTPYGITPEGDIVGGYSNSSGSHGFVLKRH